MAHAVTNLVALVGRRECDHVFDIHGVFHKFNEFSFLDGSILLSTETLEQFAKLFRSDLGSMNSLPSRFHLRDGLVSVAFALVSIHNARISFSILREDLISQLNSDTVNLGRRRCATRAHSRMRY